MGGAKRYWPHLLWGAGEILVRSDVFKLDDGSANCSVHDVLQETALKHLTSIIIIIIFNN